MRPEWIEGCLSGLLFSEVEMKIGQEGLVHCTRRAEKKLESAWPFGKLPVDETTAPVTGMEKGVAGRRNLFCYRMDAGLGSSWKGAHLRRIIMK